MTQMLFTHEIKQGQKFLVTKLRRVQLSLLIFTYRYSVPVITYNACGKTWAPFQYSMHSPTECKYLTCKASSIIHMNFSHGSPSILQFERCLRTISKAHQESTQKDSVFQVFRRDPCAGISMVFRYSPTPFAYIITVTRADYLLLSPPKHYSIPKSYKHLSMSPRVHFPGV